MINGKKIGMIGACDINGLIGYDGQLAFKNSTDLKRFKELTMGSTLIMGSKTFASLPKSGLPGRKIIVLHNNFEKPRYEGEVMHHNNIVESIKSAITEKIWIAGGAQIYKEALILHIPDFIDLTILNGIVMSPIKDNLKTQREKSVNMPEISYMWRVVSEVQNEEDPKLFHRRYEIREPWGWKD